MPCVSCGAGLHFECEINPCCCGGSLPVAEEDDANDNRRFNKRGRGWSRDLDLKDQQSTGRKRAAKAYPLDRTKPCEWQGLRLAGGGRFPIVGCTNGLQAARHHGPDKNTLNNERGNVHRICATCHNRWHTRNDPEYIPGDPGKNHDPETKASVEEIIESELYWTRNKVKKVKED